MQGENPPKGGGQQPIYGEQQQNQTVVISANTPWVQQLELWMMPHGFLQAAAKNNATASSKTVAGKKYTVLTFTGQNKAKVNGYINDQNWVERVETRVENEVLIQAIFRDYEDFGGLKAPTVIMQKRNGNLSQILIVKEARPNS